MDTLDTSNILTEHNTSLPQQPKFVVNTTAKYSFQKAQLCLDQKALQQRDQTPLETLSAHKTPNSSRSSRFPTSNIFALNFSKRDLIILPTSIFDHANNLLILDLSRNKFTEFPLELLKLTKLTTLKMESNYLKKIPSEISELTQLENLSFSHNYILTVPKTINKLAKTLVSLNLANNHIENLPREITELHNLKILWIQSNSFISLPSSFNQLTNLKELGLEWFKYTSPPLPVILNEKSRASVQRLYDLCAINAQAGKPEVSFEDFITYFSEGKDTLLNAKDTLHRNILHIATLEEELGIVRYLVTHREDLVNELDQDKQTPLSLAVREEKYFVAKLLLLHGADTKKGGGAFGSALHMATTKLQVGLVKELLKHGANPNSLDFEGNTPLHLLLSIYSKDNKSSYQIAQALMEHGAQPNIFNADLWTPVHLAVRRGQTEALKWIVKHNFNMRYEGKDDKLFDLNLKGGSDQWTPLHLAASLGHYEMIYLLLENDADINERTRTGKSIRDVAANNVAVSKMLRRLESEWISKNIFKNRDLGDKLKEISNSTNVMHLKSMIHTTTNRNVPNLNILRMGPAKNKFILPEKALPAKPKALQRQRERENRESITTQEDSLHLGDVDEVVEPKETARSIPRSPNNIQKIHIAQSYRHHLLSLFSQNVDPNMTSTVKESARSTKSTFSSNSLPAFATGTHKTHQNKNFLFPSDFNMYIKNFDNYHDEIKNFQKTILDDFDVALPEKLKALFFLKTIHLKISQTLKKIYSELLPVELFIICEYIDDEYKRTKYLSNKSHLNNSQNADLIPRTLLFIFENLDHQKNSVCSFLKGQISQCFGEFNYHSARHFLEQFLEKFPKNKYLKSQITIALRSISIDPVIPKTHNRSASKGSINYLAASKENLMSRKNYQQYSTATPHSGKKFNRHLMEKCENVEDDDDDKSENYNTLLMTDKKPLTGIPRLQLLQDSEGPKKPHDHAVSRVKTSLILSERGDTPRPFEIKESPKNLRVENYFSQI